ncbi:DUF5591 domain-containing protein [Cuniculiplasma sp. SKW3]|uniref:DUF5591 domain-containing protein n=1 Tax=Cuniculiplasma sp. SKW3 TaxID=3400170 RepID=UPI003FCFC2FB
MIKSQNFFAFARKGEITIKEKVTEFPMLLDSTKDMKSNFDSYEILNESCTLLKIKVGNKEMDVWESENFFVLRDTPDFILRSGMAIKQILEVKKKLGGSKLLYIPGISDPYLIPIFFFLGVDVFDDVNSRIDGINKVKYTIFGRVKEDNYTTDANVEFIKNELSLLSKSIDDGTLFNIVEHSNISPKTIEIIRNLETKYYEEFESSFPRYTPKILAGGLDSLSRPDVRRFNHYISNDYRKVNSARIALFVPCSAKKPYSSSKSHKRLIEAIRPFRNVLHEIILTSPISVVPRDLEDTYPPRFYDIPVTGTWYEEEKKNINGVITNFLANNPYDELIFFLPEDMKFVEDFNFKNSHFIQWDKSRNDEFGDLIDLLKKIEVKDREKRDFLKEKLISIASYQFGGWIRPYLMGMKVTRMFNQFMLTSKGKPQFIFNDEIGKLTIHRDAAKIFLDANKFLIEIEDFKPTSNIYAMGIQSSSEEIRQGDEVVIHHRGQARGVGTARMSHTQMLSNKKGIAVKMRN